jgi:hypothetical protein
LELAGSRSGGDAVADECSSKHRAALSVRRSFALIHPPLGLPLMSLVTCPKKRKPPRTEDKRPRNILLMPSKTFILNH